MEHEEVEQNKSNQQDIQNNPITISYISDEYLCLIFSEFCILLIFNFCVENDVHNPHVSILKFIFCSEIYFLLSFLDAETPL
jgi:hypothetical protein